MGIANSLSRELERDQREFFPILANVLTQSMPEQTELTTQGMFKKRIVKITVQIGEDRLVFEDPGKGAVTATRSHIVRGIALKNEALKMQDALGALSEAIETRANENAQARAALAKTLGLD